MGALRTLAFVVDGSVHLRQADLLGLHDERVRRLRVEHLVVHAGQHHRRSVVKFFATRAPGGARVT